MAGLVSQLVMPSRATPLRVPGQLSLDPVWTTGGLSDGVGPANIVVTDLTNDGHTDLLTCSNGYAYALNKVAGPAGYDTTWYSEYLGCSKVAAGDRDGDNVQEIYIGTDSGQVVIFAGDTFAPISTLTPPGSGAITDLGMADVDADSQAELVVVRTDTTLVYDAQGLTLQWNAVGKGGDQLGLGQIDNDPIVEIVVNGNPAHVLNAATQTEKWGYSGGFGLAMAVGDVDGDQVAEIVYTVGGGYSDGIVYAFDARTFANKWQTSPVFPGYIALAVGDTDGDGVKEVEVGQGQWGSVIGLRGTDGVAIWGIGNPEHGVFGIGVGDTDNDGAAEVVWGSGLSSSGADVLYVGSPATQSVEWGSDDLDGPFYVASGDLDNDGQQEIVMATHSTVSNYDGGTVRVYDGVTHQQRWSAMVANSFYNISQVGVGQLDGDPALEIVVGGENWYDARLSVFDGVTHQIEWQSAVLASGSPTALLVQNIDSDPVSEIVVGLNYSNEHVLVFNGASPVIQWDSGPLDGGILDLAVGDLDGNGTPDLAVLTSSSFYVFDTATWTQRRQQAVAGPAQLGIVRTGPSGPGQLLVAAGGTLTALAGDDFHTLGQTSLGGVTINDLATGDLEWDGSDEFMLAGTDSANRSYLRLGSPTNPPTWLALNNGNWGSLTSVSLADVDQDGVKEVFFGSSYLIQEDDVTGLVGATPTATPPSTSTPTATGTRTPGTPSGTTTATPSHTPSPSVTQAVASPSWTATVSTPDPTSSPTSTPNSTPTTCAVQFADVPLGSTFYDYIRCLACRGIVGGYPCGGPGEPCPGAYYRPNNNVTRGQVSKIVAESAGFADPVPSTQQTFADVAPGSTFHLWIERLATRGIIGGYPCGGPFEPCIAPDNRPYFRPNNNVTRGQLSKITSGAAGWTETPTGQTFEDVPPGQTFYLYIERMAGRGIIQGYPCGGPFEPCVAPDNRPYFRSNNNATRGQMSKIAAAAFFPNCQTPRRP